MPDTKLLNAMDTLEKLSKKKKDHPKHQSNERFLLSIMMLVLIPFIFGIAIDSEVIHSSVSFNLQLYGLGVLGFGLALAAMEDLMLFSRCLKLIGLVISQGWFIYFWAFQMQAWFAFGP